MYWYRRKRESTILFLLQALYSSNNNLWNTLNYLQLIILFFFSNPFNGQGWRLGEQDAPEAQPVRQQDAGDHVVQPVAVYHGVHNTIRQSLLRCAKPAHHVLVERVPSETVECVQHYCKGQNKEWMDEEQQEALDPRTHSETIITSEYIIILLTTV